MLGYVIVGPVAVGEIIPKENNQDADGKSQILADD